MFLGTLIATALWAVTCVQTWYYFDNYPHDGYLLRGTVVATFISDTVHQVLICAIVYTYFIVNFGDASVMQRVLGYVRSVEVLFNGLTGLIVQIFLTYRIWTFKRNIPLIILLGTLIVGGFATAAAYMGMGIAMELDTYEKLKELRGLSMSINALNAITDLTISAAICTYLNISRTGFAWSNHVINRLILFSINTGLLTSVCACMSLITILVFPDELIYFGFYFISEYVYSNSLLATLNARKSIRNGPSSNSTELEVRSRSVRNPRLRVDDRRASRPGIQVQIETIHDATPSDRHSMVSDLKEPAGVVNISSDAHVQERDDCESTSEIAEPVKSPPVEGGLAV
ncbi:hypothetical protein PM082_020342 [Marasmius tenuissimus]|nr:hypothetical protein PM082_020342 [Marasmius tenuissimus]